MYIKLQMVVYFADDRRARKYVLVEPDSLRYDPTNTADIINGRVKLINCNYRVSREERRKNGIFRLSRVKVLE